LRDLPIKAADRADFGAFFGNPLESLPIFDTLVR
jgi:hypothetical protein